MDFGAGFPAERLLAKVSDFPVHIQILTLKMFQLRGKKAKKREPENRLPRWIPLWFRLERVAQVEANAARVLVAERLAVP